MNLLETSGLGKSFGGIHAVDDVDLAIREGEIRGLIGPNGAGKTTLVSLLAGRILPDHGDIRFDQSDITRLPAWKRVRLGIAYTFQITSIYPTLTVSENVAMGAQVQTDQHAPARAGRLQMINTIISECLEETGLSAYAGDRAGELAYGHQRLLEIAMGLALGPRLLILDEPTQGLSDSEIDAFIILIRKVSSNQTILLIEHNMPVVMSLAEQITVMDQGRILAQGTPSEIQSNDQVQAAYLGG